MLVSLEILAHFQCPDCKRKGKKVCWFNVSDTPVKRGDVFTCPHCSQPSAVSDIQNGEGKSVNGVFWKYTKSPDLKPKS